MLKVENLDINEDVERRSKQRKDSKQSEHTLGTG